jgi:lysophospholipase L1-like esterase
MLMPILAAVLLSASAASLTAGEPRSDTGSVTPVERERGRHEQFLKRIASGPTDVLFIGDSIIDFWPRFGADTWAKFKAYRPANFGVMNDRTDNVLWRLQNGELDGFKPEPKAVVIMIGINNFGHYAAAGTNAWETPEWCAAGVREIVLLVRQKLPKSKVLLYGILPSGLGTPEQNARIPAANAILKTFADGKNVFFFDIGDRFLVKGAVTKEIFFDLLHPSAKGYQVWFEHLDPLLKKLIK